MCVLLGVTFFNALIGTVLMLLYSGRNVIRAYRREFPLTQLTSLLPIGMASGCYTLQLLLFSPSDALGPLIGGGLGTGIGYLLGRSHKVFAKNGMIFARRTWVYVLFWVLSNGFTHLSGMLGLREIADFGFIAGAFTTCVVVVLHLVLWARYIKKRAALNSVGGVGLSCWAVMAFGAAATLLIALTPAYAIYLASSAQQAARAVLQTSDFHPYRVSQVDMDWHKVMEAPDFGERFGTIVKVFGLGSRWDMGMTGFQAKLGSSLGLRSRFMLVYAPPWTGLVRTAQYSVAQALAERLPGIAATAQRGERSDKTYHIRSYQCGEHCVGVYYECGFYGIKTIGNWTYILEYQLLRKSAAYGAQLEDPNPATCTQHSVPQNGERIFSLIGQRLGQVQYQGDIAAGPLGDPGTAAGVITSLIQLLTGLGMLGAGNAAQAAAAATAAGAAAASTTAQAATDAASGSAAATAAQTTTSSGDQAAQPPPDASPPRSDVRILDGQDAINWLKDERNGFYDRDGNHPTQRFHDWMDQSPWAPDSSGLLGFAGDLDENNEPTGDFAIAVAGPLPPKTDIIPEPPDFWTRLWDDLLTPEERPVEQELERPDSTVDPCVELRGDLLDINTRGQNLVDERNDCVRKLRAFDQRIRNLREIAKQCYALDASIILGSILAGLTLGPVGMIGTALFLGLVSEAVKASIRERLEGNQASAWDKGSGVGKSVGAQGFAEGAKHYLLSKGVPKALAQGIANKISFVLSTGSAAWDLRKAAQEIDQIRNDRQRYKDHYDHLQEKITDLRGQRDAKKKLLEGCQQTHGV